MPLEHSNPRYAECPYCYDGHLVYDGDIKKVYCCKCSYIALIGWIKN